LFVQNTNDGYINQSLLFEYSASVQFYGKLIDELNEIFYFTGCAIEQNAQPDIYDFSRNILKNLGQ